MNQFQFTLLLFQCLIITPARTETNVTRRRKILTILYLTDSPLHTDSGDLFTSFQKKITNSTGDDRAVKIQREVLPTDAGRLMPTLKILSRSLSWSDTGIIILDVKEEKLKGISLLSCAGLVFDIRTRPISTEKIFLNTITVKPSLSRLHGAVERIFGEIGWTTMAEIECYSSRQNLDSMMQQLESIKASTFTFIFVKCLDKIDLVLKYAKTIGLTTSDYRWVFPGILSLREISSYLPKNVIAIDLPGSSLTPRSRAEEDILFLKDVLKVLEITMTENSKKLRSENEWTSKRFITLIKRYIISRTFPGYTGDIIFDQEGQRSGEIYEIFELITFNGKYQWLPIGSLERGNVNILFNQWRLENKNGSPEIPKVRVVTLLKSPFVMLASEQFRSESTGCVIGHLCRQYRNTTSSSSLEVEYEDYCCTGFIIEFIERLERDVGFHGMVHIVKDGKFGSNDPQTLKWNGMIGELVRNEADMAVSTLTITAKRSKVVDFTYPYTDAAIGILVSTEAHSHRLWEFAFLNTFSGPLWLALFITVQIVIIILWLAERLRKRRRFINDPFKRDNSISYDKIINYTWALVFQKASEETGPSTLGGRTVAALFAFCTIIACSSFTANLAAHKVSARQGVSISGIHDSKFQNPNGYFKFGTIADSANLDFFRDSDDPKFQRIYKQLRKNLVSSSEEGGQKVQDREWTAFIDDIPQLSYLTSKQTDCKLKIVGDPFFFSGYGIALRKNSSWNTRLSLEITNLVRNGFIQNLKSKWLPSACRDLKQTSNEKMDVNDIGGAFLIVGFGCVASGIVLAVEYAVWRAMAATAGPISDRKQAQNLNQALSTLTRVFTLWDVSSSSKYLSAEATLRNFRTLAPGSYLGDCASVSRDLQDCG